MDDVEQRLVVRLDGRRACASTTLFTGNALTQNANTQTHTHTHMMRTRHVDDRARIRDAPHADAAVDVAGRVAQRVRVRAVPATPLGRLGSLDARHDLRAAHVRCVSRLCGAFGCALPRRGRKRPTRCTNVKKARVGARTAAVRVDGVQDGDDACCEPYAT